MKLGVMLNEEIFGKFEKIPEEAHCLYEKFKSEVYDNIDMKSKPEKIHFHVATNEDDYLAEHTIYIFMQFTEKYLNLKKALNCQGCEIIFKNEKYIFLGESYAKNILERFRPFIYNKNDSIFYKKIHKLLRNLLGAGGHKEKIVTVLSNGDDVTNIFLKEMDCANSLINKIVSAMDSDLDYIYNGILMHTDSRFNKRMDEDLFSGELHYLILKNATILSNLICFFDYYWILIRWFGSRSSNVYLLE